MKLVIVSFLLIQFAASLKLTCDFGISNPGGLLGPMYRCLVKEDPKIESPPAIDAIEGDHESGKTNADVKGMYFDSTYTVHYFPTGIGNFFPNLVRIFIYSTDLMAITQSDLKPFPNLKALILDGNKLTTLKSDLFKFNPNLQEISFYDNKLTSIATDLFDPITDLKKAEFRRNVCIDVFGEDPEAIAELKSVIVAKCN